MSDKVPMSDLVDGFLVDDLDDPEGTFVTGAFLIVMRARPDQDRPHIAYVASDGMTWSEQIGMVRQVAIKLEHDSLAAWEDDD